MVEMPSRWWEPSWEDANGEWTDPTPEELAEYLDTFDDDELPFR